MEFDLDAQERTVDVYSETMPLVSALQCGLLPPVPTAEVGGTVRTGWHYTRRSFEESFRNGGEQGAQLTIYHEAQRVVDIFGRAASQISPYSDKCMQSILNCGQVIESICIIILVDRGLLRYEDPVSKYWPQFGQNGKRDITVSDVLRHESGLPFLTNTRFPEDESRDTKLTYDAARNLAMLERKIEESCRQPAGRRYHTFTRGWILSGLILRVDPKHRSLRTFMKDEICTPLRLDIYCSVGRLQQRRQDFVDLAGLNTMDYLLKLMIPSVFSVEETASAASSSVMESADMKRSLGVLQLTRDTDLATLSNSPHFRALEASSMNIHANSRSLGKLAALMAAGGQLDGVQLFSREAASKAMSDPKYEYDHILQCTHGLTIGGFAKFDVEQSKLPVASEGTLAFLDGCYGWAGFGGSLFVFDPRRNFALAYAGNKLSTRLLGSASLDIIFNGVRRSFSELRRVKRINREAGTSPNTPSPLATSPPPRAIQAALAKKPTMSSPSSSSSWSSSSRSLLSRLELFREEKKEAVREVDYSEEKEEDGDVVYSDGESGSEDYDSGEDSGEDSDEYSERDSDGDDSAKEPPQHRNKSGY